MFAPGYLPESDRRRLAEINSILYSGVSFGVQDHLTPERARELEAERAELKGRMKDLPECTYDELQELRQQLYEQFQKHAALNTNQSRLITRYLEQVEFRAAVILEQEARKEKKTNEVATRPTPPKGPSRVSTKQTGNSWSVDFDG